MNRRAFLCLALALAMVAPLSADGQLQVSLLVKDGRVEVSFHLLDGFTDDLRGAIKSGLPASITYEIELRRPAFIWFDKTVALTTVTTSVQYDNLMRNHQLTRLVDGRGEPPSLTTDEEAVRTWLTGVDKLPLFDTAGLEPNGEYLRPGPGADQAAGVVGVLALGPWGRHRLRPVHLHPVAGADAPGGSSCPPLHHRF